jgi:hypothetical protein
MDRVLKIAGIIVVAWLALGLVGWVFHFLVSAVFFLALVAGGIWLVSSITGRSKHPIGARRDYARLR